MKPTLSLIAALDEKRGLGKSNRLLFKIPADLKRFKKLTLGHAVIMGRRTFQSLGRPLPGRLNIVVTRNRDFQAPDCLVAHSLKEAMALAKDKEEEKIFIIGGGQIYQQTIGQADRLYLTLVEGDFGADTFFPPYSQFKKKVFEKKGQWQGLKYRFLELKR